jgi:protein-disulfide isomerase
LKYWVLFGLLIASMAGVAMAQGGFRETWRMKLPAGAPVAIYEFEDMECPGCAEAAPLVRATAAKYNIPLVRKDFTLLSHTWSLDAAISARVLEDTASAALAESYRKDLFATQSHIASRDDLRAWTKAWFTNHGRKMPTAADMTGRARTQVLDDRSFGNRIGIHETPTFFVVTAKGATEVEEAKDLDAAVKKALGR